MQNEKEMRKAFWRQPTVSNMKFFIFRALFSPIVVVVVVAVDEVLRFRMRIK